MEGELSYSNILSSIAAVLFMQLFLVEHICTLLQINQYLRGGISVGETHTLGGGIQYRQVGNAILIVLTVQAYRP